MNLIESLKKYKSEISDNSILVEYALYFRKVAENQCKFEIYVNTYGIDFTEANTHIYADSLWVDTKLEVEEIYNFFSDFRKVEPTDIVSLEDDETVDGTIALVMSVEGKVTDYNSFIKEKKSCKIKSLYWD